MKVHAWFKYLIYLILVCLLSMLRGYFGTLFKNWYFNDDFNMPFYAIIIFLLGVSIGLLIGMEQFLQVRRSPGVWKINLPKLIILGLPSLYVALFHIYIAIGNSLISVIATPLIYIFRYGTTHVTVFQIILGYVIITSITKQNATQDTL